MTNNLAPQQPETNNGQPPISEKRPVVATEVVEMLEGTHTSIHKRLDEAKLDSLKEQIELSIKENGEKLAAIGQMINEVCGEGYVK